MILNPIPEKPRIYWEGTQFRHQSLAIVNRELCLALLASGRCDLGILPYEPHEFGVEEDPVRFPLISQRLLPEPEGPVDFHIRHQWPPNLKAPHSGHWIVMQPWESGSMPAAWFRHFRDTVDDIWVYSTYNRECYIQDGIPPEKVAVIPLAVNFNRFKPEIPPLPRLSEQTRGRFTFLFVGGTLWRKGIDILLETYVQAFYRSENVSLVIKDMGGDTFYEGKTARDLISQIQSDPATPEIIHIRETLPEAVLPRIYASCDCLVHPYRGEGFGMPVAEAMACGLPVIIPMGGAANDFTTDDTVFYIPARQKSAHIEIPTVREARFLEPDRTALIQRMRHVAAHPAEAIGRGKRAAVEIRKRLSWEKSAQKVMDRLSVIGNRQLLPAFRKSSAATERKRSEAPIDSNTLSSRGSGDRKQSRSGRVQGEGMPNDFAKGADLNRNQPSIKENQLMVNHPRIDPVSSGEEFFQNGDIEKALRVFDDIVKKDPGNPTALNNKGVALNKLGLYEEAEQVFNELLHTNVQYPDAVYNSISNYLSAENWDKVQESLNRYGTYLSGEQLEAITAAVQSAADDMTLKDGTLIESTDSDGSYRQVP